MLPCLAWSGICTAARLSNAMFIKGAGLALLWER